MKNKALFLISLFALTACSGGGKSSSETADGDDDNAVYAEVRDFNSPDLAFNELHSKVLKVEHTTYYNAEKQGDEFVPVDEGTTDVVEFNDAGLMVSETSYSEGKKERESSFTHTADGKTSGVCNYYDDGGADKQKITVERDADGYITKTEYRVENYDSDRDNINVYTWKNGLITKYEYTGWEWGTTYDYEYDNKGNRVRESWKSVDIMEEWETVRTFTYKTFDKYDNWTKRVVEDTTEAYEYDNNDRRKHTGTQKTYIIEKRKIVYAE